MHTLRMMLAGLVLLALMVGAAKLVRSPSWTVSRAVSLFIPIWALIAVGNMLVGMFSAGIPFLTELVVLIAVLGVPAAAAWWIGQRAGS
jgi:hypothetical protein